jgi:integrase
MGKRSYGTGRLFARVDSGGREHWYGTWWAGGVRVKRKLGLKSKPGTSDGLTRVQAEAELRRRIATDTVVAAGSRRTVQEAGDAYITHLETVMERKRTTIADYRGYLRKHLGPYFGGRPLDKIDRAYVEQYLLAKKREGLSAKTIQNHLNFLHGIWAFSIKREWATANPVALVDRPKAPRWAHRRIRFLSNEQLDALLRAVPDDELGPLERATYLCAALTGLRQGELLALRWCDVDWTAKRVRVSESFTRGAFDSPKSHRGRSVPLADRLAGELERHFQRSRFRGENDLVFAHPLTGSPYDPSKLRKRFDKALERAGVPRITFHELRHTFGTRMAAAGAPLRTIQHWMGHADMSTTEIYAHYSPDPTGHAALIEKAFASPAASSSSLDLLSDLSSPSSPPSSPPDPCSHSSSPTTVTDPPPHQPQNCHQDPSLGPPPAPQLDRG